jgi:hypothetical protein
MTTTREQQLEEEVRALKSQLSAVGSESLHAENVAFCESLTNIPYFMRSIAIANMDALSAMPEPIQFSEGDGSESRPLLDAFKLLLSKIPCPIQFGEYATKERAADVGDLPENVDFAGMNVDQDGLLVLSKAKRYQEAHKVDFVTAVKAVS